MQQLIMDSAEMNLNLECAELGDLLDELNRFIPEGRIISKLYLDDREVMDQGHDVLRAQQLDPVQTVRIETSSIELELQLNVSDILSYFKEMRPILRQAGRELRYGSITDASRKLADCFEGMETMVQYIDQFVSVLPTIDAAFSDDELKHFSEREGALLSDLIIDFQNQDWLALADRIEFQLDPLLGRWQKILERVSTLLKGRLALRN